MKTNRELNITWLYPDILSLHGDRGNVIALKTIGEKLDLKVNINRVDNLEDDIDFENTDILMINPGEVKLVEPIVESLDRQREELVKYIKENGIILVIGTSGAIFGNTLKLVDDRTIDCLGIFDMDSFEKDKIYGNDVFYYFTPEEGDEMQMVGSEISIIDFSLNNKEQALSTTEYGKGNNTKHPDGLEGARVNNVFFTNALGPLLIKNPWFAQYLIEKAMKAKDITFSKQELANLDFEMEKKALSAIRKFITNKELIEKGI